MSVLPSAAVAQAFGCVIPGRPPNYSDTFVQVRPRQANWPPWLTADGEPFRSLPPPAGKARASRTTRALSWERVQVDAMRWQLDVENSQQIRDVCFFLTQPLNMPGAGLSCYITGPPFEK
jgi:hypothetical protein